MSIFPVLFFSCMTSQMQLYCCSKKIMWTDVWIVIMDGFCGLQPQIRGLADTMHNNAFE